MNLSEVKEIINELDGIVFQLPNKSFVPKHFHITEVGTTTKNFIDCGGTVREEKVINFQLWEANDYDHRVAPQKLKKIIEISEKALGIDPLLNIEVEYQSGTIGKYDLDFDGTNFQLINKNTTCLASDNCGVPAEKQKLNLSELNSKEVCCSPGGACC